MLLTFKTFGGIAPKVDPRRLVDTGAQTASNTKLWRGNLQSFRNPLLVATLPNTGTIKTIYRWNQSYAAEDGDWLAWTVDVDVCKGFIASDTTERTYWTDGTAPKKADSTNIATGVRGSASWPAGSWDMKVPAPTNAPTVTQAGATRTMVFADSVTALSSTASITGSATPYTGALKETLAAQPASIPTMNGKSYSGVITEEWTYVYTYITAWDEESMPSPASDIIVVDPTLGHTVTTDTGPSPNTYNINRKRLYRSSVTTSGAAAYQFVREDPLSPAAVTDTKLQDELAEPLPSLYWDTPPDDLTGLCAMQNGIMAGFSKNNLCFSEAFHPHAWPSSYRHALDYKIVAVKSFTTYLVVGTEGHPYVFQGTDPSSMMGQRIESRQACVSKRSMVAMEDGVIYASPDGLIFVSPNGVKNLTEDIFTRDDWQAMTPANFEAYSHEGRYFAFNSTNNFALCLDPSVPAVYNLTNMFVAGFQDLKRDALYLLPAGGVKTIKKWEGDSTLMTYTWRSKKFVLPRAINFAVAQVEAQAYPVSFSLIVDGVTKVNAFSVTSEAPFRLPSGFMGKEVEIEIAGTATVNAVYVATSIAELAEV